MNQITEGPKSMDGFLAVHKEWIPITAGPERGRSVVHLVNRAVHDVAETLITFLTPYMFHQVLKFVINA